VVDNDYIRLLRVDILDANDISTKNTEHSVGDELANEVNHNTSLVEWIADNEGYPREQIEHKTD
jgi:hypothetical protein